MPWDTIGYDKKRYSDLMSKFGLSGIPALVLLKGNGESEELADKGGRAFIG